MRLTAFTTFFPGEALDLAADMATEVNRTFPGTATVHTLVERSRGASPNEVHNAKSGFGAARYATTPFVESISKKIAFRKLLYSFQPPRNLAQRLAALIEIACRWANPSHHQRRSSRRLQLLSSNARLWTGCGELNFFFLNQLQMYEYKARQKI